MPACSWDWYKNILGSPKYIVAPMVDQSELPWRILSRRYKSQLCYTPMINARIFKDDAKYRADNFSTNKDDRPLIAQFCANDPDVFIEACKLIQGDCDGVDLNLGCPQGIAKRGHYGSFLQDEWELIAKLVSKAHKELDVPISCKIRIFPDVEKSIKYAKMLQEAGCQLLTVHGRVRDQKGQITGVACWEQIRRIKEELDIPVIANGNIMYFEDVQECLRTTGADGVMTAEGNLTNPAIFDCDGQQFSSLYLAREYLDICLENTGTVKPGTAKSHLFKLLHKLLAKHVDVRLRLGQVKSFSDLFSVIDELDKLEPEAKQIYVSTENKGEGMNGLERILPDWVAQPYVRKDAAKNQLGKKRKMAMMNENSQIIDDQIQKKSHELEV